MPRKPRRQYQGPQLYVLLQPTLDVEKVRCPECGNIITAVQVTEQTGPMKIEQWCRWCKTMVIICPDSMRQAVLSESSGD